jgi:DNA-binding response OmpR family regulator
MKILIIEDEKLIADSLREGLEYHKFIVDVAYNGRDGYLLIMQFKYDLIILDLMLPDICGEEICKRLRKEKNNTLIIMLTAKKMLNDIIYGLNCGADDYLTKPFEFSMLLAKIETMLERNSVDKESKLN